MKILKEDLITGIKLAIEGCKYMIYLRNEWYGLNVLNENEAYKIYRNMVFEEQIDERKRIGDILIG